MKFIIRITAKNLSITFFFNFKFLDAIAFLYLGIVRPSIPNHLVFFYGSSIIMISLNILELFKTF